MVLSAFPVKRRLEGGRVGGCEWEARAGAHASSMSAALHGIVLKKLKEP